MQYDTARNALPSRVRHYKFLSVLFARTSSCEDGMSQTHQTDASNHAWQKSRFFSSVLMNSEIRVMGFPQPASLNGDCSIWKYVAAHRTCGVLLRGYFVTRTRGMSARRDEERRGELDRQRHLLASGSPLSQRHSRLRMHYSNDLEVSMRQLLALYLGPRKPS
jgi:hypothetical protein